MEEGGGGRLQEREKMRERGGCKNGKERERGRGAAATRGRKSGRGEKEDVARVREERASRSLDANQRPKTHSLNRAPDPGERMPKKIYCFSEVSAS
jgi:hypothetical protein